MKVSAHPGRMDDREFALNIYRAYSEKVAHEDQLINQRTFWFVTFEALLFTSFALLTQSEFGPIAFNFATAIFWFLGFGAACFSLASILAAYDAISSTDKQWKDCLKESSISGYFAEFGECLPGVIGDGKNSGIDWRGKYAAISLPCLVMIGWSFLALVVFLAPDVTGNTQ